MSHAAHVPAVEVREHASAVLTYGSVRAMCADSRYIVVSTSSGYLVSLTWDSVTEVQAVRLSSLRDSLHGPNPSPRAPSPSAAASSSSTRQSPRGPSAGCFSASPSSTPSKILRGASPLSSVLHRPSTLRAMERKERFLLSRFLPPLHPLLAARVAQGADVWVARRQHTGFCGPSPPPA